MKYLELVKTITDKGRQPCLVGGRSFNDDIQQFTCKSINNCCSCYKEYKFRLDTQLDLESIVECTCGREFKISEGFKSNLYIHDMVCTKCYQKELDSRRIIEVLRKGQYFFSYNELFLVIHRYTKKTNNFLIAESMNFRNKLEKFPDKDQTVYLKIKK